MAIKLKVQDTTVRLKTVDNTVNLKTETGIPIYPTPYTGETSITPTESEQVLETSGLMMTNNVTIAPIPNNYGLITWDGTKITVS